MPAEIVTLVVPTYNERENLPRLVEGVAASMDRPWEMLVVDDGSPDGTAEVARQLASKHPVSVIERAGKLGLGSAYREGFQRAAAGPVVAMDADLSHDPRHLPALLRALDDGADLALGSRYIAGGKVEGWKLKRRVTSGGANVLARMVLRLGCKDCTGGYRAYGPLARELALLSKSDGYAFQIEALYLSRRAGLEIAEVPITFRDRRIGVSKLGPHEITRFVGTLRRLRFA